MATNIPLTFVYQGKPITIVQGIIESNNEYKYRLEHTLVISPYPVSEGFVSTYRMYGMYFGNDDTIHMDITKSKTVSTIIKDSEFRPRILSYLRTYLNLPDWEIIHMIGRGSSDKDIISDMRPIQIESIDTTSILSTIPHVPITSTLNLNMKNFSMQRKNKQYQLIIIDRVFHLLSDSMIIDLYEQLSPGGLMIIQDFEYTKSNEYIQALDIVTMGLYGAKYKEIDIRYKSSLEWNTFLISIGLMSRFIKLIDSTVGLYTAVYQRVHDIDTNTKLILEFPTKKQKHAEYFFPKLPSNKELKEGINYNEEMLSYITTPKHAVITSISISNIIKKNYDPSVYKNGLSLYDGTAGAGGNILAFKDNRDINRINAYERDPTFFKFLVNNIELYTGLVPIITSGNIYEFHLPYKKTIYCHNKEFPLNTLIQSNSLMNSILFLDVPWIRTSTGYELTGYKYSGLFLEDVVRSVLESGALLVSLKLPKGYKLNIKYDPNNIVDMEKSILINILPSDIKKEIIDNTALIQELVKHRLIIQMKDLFLSEYPSIDAKVFDEWMLNTLQSTGIKIPGIPYTSSPILIKVSIPTSVPTEYLALKTYIDKLKEKRPNIEKELGIKLSRITAIKVAQRLQEILGTEEVSIDMNDKAKKIYDIYVSTSIQNGDIRILISDNKISINPGANVSKMLQSLPQIGKGNIFYPLIITIPEDKMKSLLLEYGRNPEGERDIAIKSIRYDYSKMFDFPITKEIAPSTKISLLTEDEIHKRFGNTYNGKIMTQDHTGSNFMRYCVKRFYLGGENIKPGDAVKNLLSHASSGKADDNLYLYMRKLRSNNMGYTPTVRELQEIEEEAYIDTITTKVNELKNTYSIMGDIPLSEVSMLDIGTERLEFLDELGKYMKSVNGINISTGFCHYDESFVDNTKDPRFKLYDGKNIPYPDKSFDLITMYSVIHHISNDDIPIVAKEIARVCKGYLFIKDVDLINEPTKAAFRSQHDLYEGVLMPGDKSFLNDTVTYNSTIEILQSNGFSVISSNMIPNFNRSYYVLLKFVGVLNAK